MRKTVVILIPVYNSERTLKVCVDSLLAQDYPHIKEIIFMDNLSTDATPSILKSYGKKITVKRLSGLVPEMYNKIIPGIDSDCIAFTDGDVIADRSWISNLVKGFNMPEIKATAGYCGTVESSNVLQQAIGEELEDRFRHFSTFIGRAPTMNLCVDTEVMKRLMYDSTLRVAYDTDFGMRLNEAGFLMRYVPDAVIYHDHRASWKAYYRQQNTYAKYAPLVYMKHFGQTAGDSISMSTMMFQPMAYGLCVFFLLLSLFHWVFLLPIIMFGGIIGLTYYHDYKRLDSKIPGSVFYRMFLTRAVAWTFGLPIGTYILWKNKNMLSLNRLKRGEKKNGKGTNKA